jgi:hypothetical protein
VHIIMGITGSGAAAAFTGLQAEKVFFGYLCKVLSKRGERTLPFTIPNLADQSARFSQSTKQTLSLIEFMRRRDSAANSAVENFPPDFRRFFQASKDEPTHVSLIIDAIASL